MKRKLVKAMGVVLTAGMLASGGNLAFVGAASLSGSDGAGGAGSNGIESEMPEGAEGSSEETESDAESTPGETVIPAVSESPAPSESPAVSESPAPSESPAVSESPAPSESPAVSESPAPSESPAVSESPVSTETPAPEGEYGYEPVTGAMVKGPWILPDGRKVFYDTETGKMVKGEYEINGVKYHFDETDGRLTEEAEGTGFWLKIDGGSYRYEGWVRQGWHPEDPDYAGEEFYDSEADTWRWLDGTDQGRMAVGKDVYIESQADAEGNIGKWVRYDRDGRMVLGWSWDGMYYFDPVYGTMAKGKTVIDGQEYEFDETTGRQMVQRGFEEYGLQCNAEAGVEYEYLTCSYLEAGNSVRGKAVFDYSVLEPDDAHPAKEGYEWKRVVASVTFDGNVAVTRGCSVSLLYDMDYYNFSNQELSKAPSGNVAERTISMQGVEYEITTRYEMLENAWGEDANVHISFAYECQVPIGYDGMVVALCNAANRDKGDRELDRMDENSLIFRLK